MTGQGNGDDYWSKYIPHSTFHMQTAAHTIASSNHLPRALSSPQRRNTKHTQQCPHNHQGLQSHPGHRLGHNTRTKEQRKDDEGDAGEGARANVTSLRLSCELLNASVRGMMTAT